MDSLNETFGTPNHDAAVVASAEHAESWYQNIVPSRQTLGLFGVIACGLTLIGATTYFVATRLVNKKRDRRRQRRSQQPYADEYGVQEDDEYDAEEIMDDNENEEDFDYRLAYERKNRRRGKGINAHRPPPLITFAELFEHALQFHQHVSAQRKVKIYFDSNDEFVREEQLPEMLLSDRSSASAKGEDADDSLD